MDAASSAAWVAAAVAVASAVVAAVQAKHAKESAASAKSQAESALRQAKAAEDELLLTRLKMRTGGDEALALQMFEARGDVVRYVRTAIELLENLEYLCIVRPDTRSGARAWSDARSKDGILKARLDERYRKFAGAESEDGVRHTMARFVRTVNSAVNALTIGGSLTNRLPSSDVELIIQRIKVVRGALEQELEDPRLFDRD